MKLSSGVLIAGAVIAGVAGFGLYRWHSVNTVFADGPLTSQFFRTYDPGPLLNEFGIVRQTGNSVGGRADTQTRGITATIALPASQVAGLSAALRDDIDHKLRTQVHLMGSGEDSGEYSYEYESSTAWGYFILERIEPEPSHGSDAATWKVRMRLIERPHK